MLGFEGWVRTCQAEKVRAVFWPEETTMQRHRRVKGFLVKAILSYHITCKQQEQEIRQKHRPEPDLKGPRRLDCTGQEVPEKGFQ